MLACDIWHYMQKAQISLKNNESLLFSLSKTFKCFPSVYPSSTLHMRILLIAHIEIETKWPMQKKFPFMAPRQLPNEVPRHTRRTKGVARRGEQGERITLPTTVGDVTARQIRPEGTMVSLSLMGTKFTGNLLQGMKYQQKVFDAAEKQDGVEEALKMLIGHKELQGEAGRKATHKERDAQARFTVQATATGYAPYSFKEHVPMHETKCERMTPTMEQMAKLIRSWNKIGARKSKT